MAAITPNGFELAELIGESDEHVNLDMLGQLGFTNILRRPKVGEIAYVYSRGQLRRGQVVAVGRKLATVAFTTHSAVREYEAGVTGKSAPHVTCKKAAFDRVWTATSNAVSTEQVEPPHGGRAVRYCVIIAAEVPAAIGPFGSDTRALDVANSWNREHFGKGQARVEKLMTYEEAEADFRV